MKMIKRSGLSHVLISISHIYLSWEIIVTFLLVYFFLILCYLSSIFSLYRCEAFPTYPRTYDMVHAAGLLSLETSQQRRCTMLDLFTEIDRLLRPEVPEPFFLFNSVFSCYTLISLFLTLKLRWSRIIE